MEFRENKDRNVLGEEMVSCCHDPKTGFFKSFESLIFKEFLSFQQKKIKIFKPDFPIFWDVKN